MSKERNEVSSDDFSCVISAGSDESESKTELSFLKYKNQINKSFKSPEHLNRLAEHMARVETALMRTRTRRAPPPIQPKPTIAPEISNVGLSTPSELGTAPSDFDHLFHAQNLAELEDNKAKERKERERKEKDQLFKIFQQSKQKDPLIPVQVSDDSSGSTQVINICLSRIMELNQQYQKEKSPMPIMKIIRMPKVTYFPKRETTSLKVPEMQTLKPTTKSTKLKLITFKSNTPKSNAPKSNSSTKSFSPSTRSPANIVAKSPVKRKSSKGKR